MLPPVTILLPLKGRHLFTLRFLWHCDRTLLPFPLLVADGEVHPTIAALLEDSRKIFPNLELEYRRYPDDVNLSRFYQKMADAAARVRTRYVMLADNDDFLCADGIAACAAALDANEEYVCWGGGVAGFSLSPAVDGEVPPLTGVVNRLRYRYHRNYMSRDLSEPKLLDRVTSGYRDYVATYYNVFRAPALLTIMKECAEIDPQLANIYEAYQAMRTLTLGKARLDPTVISYLRQSYVYPGLVQEFEWEKVMLGDPFRRDFDSLVSRIASAVAQGDGVGVERAADEIRDAFASRIRRKLASRYAPRSKWRSVRDRFREMLPTSFGRRTVRTALERRRLFAKLRADGASDSYIEIFRRELSCIEEMAGGDAFLAFVQQHAPDLLASRLAGAAR